VLGPLGLIAEVPLLKEHGVEKIYHLVPGRLDTECQNIIYLCRPSLSLMKLIAFQIRTHKKQEQPKNYSLFFIPRRTMIAERVLEEEGVYEDLTIAEYQLDFIPFENDVVSLELDTCFREFHAEHDPTSLFYVARALMRLQSLFGDFLHVSGIGSASLHVRDLLVRMQKEKESGGTSVPPHIKHLVIVDRQVDPITPMPTQLTYEGLVDEIFGIKNGLVFLQASMIPTKEGQPAPQPTRSGTVPTPMNSNDSLYSQLRNLNFSVVGPLLNKKAKEIGEYYNRKEDVKAGKLSIQELRDYVKLYKNVIEKEEQSLELHMNMAEQILALTKLDDFHKRLEAEQSMIMGGKSSLEYIEDCIANQNPLLKILRLLVIQCHTGEGLRSKQYDVIIRDILQTYGYEYATTISSLETVGLLRKAESSKGTFLKLRKAFNLIKEDVNEKQPDDVSYVYSGYAPLSIRLVESLFKPGWNAMADQLSLLNTQSFQMTQSSASKAAEDLGASRQFDNDSEVVMVLFVGGVTFTEIAALRYHNQTNQTRQYVIATTKMINGDTLLQSLFDSTLINSKQSFCTEISGQNLAAATGE